MAGVVRSKELIVWQKAKSLSVAICHISRRPPLNQDRGLCSQMQRAAVSVMSNIAEGFERGSGREFRRFLLIAKGSCGELRSQLYLALEVGLIDEAAFAPLREQAIEVSRLIHALRNSIKGDAQ